MWVGELDLHKLFRNVRICSIGAFIVDKASYYLRLYIAIAAYSPWSTKMSKRIFATNSVIISSIKAYKIVEELCMVKRSGSTLWYERNSAAADRLARTPTTQLHTTTPISTVIPTIISECFLSFSYALLPAIKACCLTVALLLKLLYSLSVSLLLVVYISVFVCICKICKYLPKYMYLKRYVFQLFYMCICICAYNSLTVVSAAGQISILLSVYYLLLYLSIVQLHTPPTLPYPVSYLFSTLAIQISCTKVVKYF